MRNSIVAICLLFLMFSIVGCSAEQPLTSTAEFEDCILSLDNAEISTNDEQQYILTVNATYTNNGSEPLYALCSFGIKVFQNDIEQMDISDINGDEQTLIREVKNGQSLQVSYKFELTDNSPVEILVCTPTADEEIIAKLEYSSADNNAPEQSTQAVNLSEQMSITEYSCVIDDSFRYYIMFIENNSDKCVKVEANIVAKDEAGANIGAYQESVGGVAPGQTSCIWTTFDEWDIINSFDYDLSVAEQPLENSIYNDVSFDYNTTENKIIVTATNNGAEPAEFVWFDVVFLKDGEMVNFREISLMNDEQQLLPGASITNEGECFSENGFDEVVYAVNGRR